MTAHMIGTNVEMGMGTAKRDRLGRKVAWVIVSVCLSACGDDSGVSPGGSSSGGQSSSDEAGSLPTTSRGSVSDSVGSASETTFATTATAGATSVEPGTTINPWETSSADSGATVTTNDVTTGPTGSTTVDMTTGGSDSGGTATTGGGAGFPPPPDFGTNVLDLDLVGTWNLNWDPASGADSVLDIDDAGNFTWTETSADCSQSSVASGYLWVESSQVVMHVETWERPLPWDTEPALGEIFPPPFRLRISFSMQGSAGSGVYLSFGGLATLTETTPYVGESYVRQDQQGSFLGGTWRGEAQLEAIPLGQSEPIVIVRDVYQAVLDAESVMDVAEGTGTRAITTTYFPTPSRTDVYAGGNWTCLDGCGPTAGTTLINGSNLYTYGPYGGHEHLMSFSSGRAFLRDVPSDCP